jgi:hypothetical protein
MAWYSDGSTTWRRRMAISVIDSAGGSPGAGGTARRILGECTDRWIRHHRNAE